MERSNSGYVTADPLIGDLLTADEHSAQVARCVADRYALELMERRAAGDSVSDDWWTASNAAADAVAKQARQTMARSTKQRRKSAPTKTEQRRQTIDRGTSADATLGQRAQASEAIDQIRQISGQPHTDHGAADSREIQQRQALAESMAAQTYIAPDETQAAVVAPATIADPRYVPLHWLLSDLRRRVKSTRDCRGWSKSERADIATDAALILCRWTSQGATAPMYLGQRGDLPMRRHWYDADKRQIDSDGKRSRPAPNERAERAMRAAILQAARDRNSDIERRLSETDEDISSLDSDEGLTLAQAALRHDRDLSDTAPILPDTDAPELLADALGWTLTAARAMYANAYKMNGADCRDQWQVSEQRVDDIRSRGAAELRKRYPNPTDLLADMRRARSIIVENLRTRAHLAVSDYSNGYASEAAARMAADHWQEAQRQQTPAQRAITIAAQRGGWAPDHIGAADHLLRLIDAEVKRGKLTATSAARGSFAASPLGSPTGARTERDRHQISAVTSLRSSSYGRAKMYARLAAAGDDPIALGLHRACRMSVTRASSIQDPAQSADQSE